MEPSAWWVALLCRPIAGKPRTPGAGHYGGAFIRGLSLSQEEQLPPSPRCPSTHSAMIDDFRLLTIQPMLEATSSMRLTIEQSLATIASTRTALATLDELARTIDDELHWRRRPR